MPQCQYKKSEKVILCQKHAKNSSLLVSGGLGTLPRLMELDVLINALNMQPYFNYSIQLSVSVVPSISITIALVTVLWHISKYTSCLPSTSLRPQWSSPEIIQSKFIFYNWKHNYKWSSFKKLICIEILADVFSVESLSTIELDEWDMYYVENRYLGEIEN